MVWLCKRAARRLSPLERFARKVVYHAQLSIIGEFVALSGVVGGSYVRLSAFFIFGVIGFVAWALMLNSDMMEEVRPAPDEFL